MSDPKPWLDTPACVFCKGPLVPVSLARPQAASNVCEIRCAACGRDYLEPDVRVVARVWWSAGAWEGREETERERSEKR